MNQPMKNRYHVFQRGWGTYYCEDLLTKKQATLKTRDKDKAFDSIRYLEVLETLAEHFLKVLEQGSVSTNIYLRRFHNFTLDICV
jgi:hypothetical protein